MLMSVFDANLGVEVMNSDKVASGPARHEDYLHKLASTFLI